MPAYSPRIDARAQVLEAHQFQDEAVRAALDDRLAILRAAHRAVIARLPTEGKLAAGWTVDGSSCTERSWQAEGLVAD